MEKNNQPGNAPDDQDDNAQHPGSPEVITLSSDDEDDVPDTDTDSSVTDTDESVTDTDESGIDTDESCPPSSSNPCNSKHPYDIKSLRIKEECLEETSKTEVSSKKTYDDNDDEDVDVNKAEIDALTVNNHTETDNSEATCDPSDIASCSKQKDSEESNSLDGLPEKTEECQAEGSQTDSGYYCPWQEMWDESTGGNYYWNVETDEVTCECPTEYIIYLKSIHSTGGEDLTESNQSNSNENHKKTKKKKDAPLPPEGATSSTSYFGGSSSEDSSDEEKENGFGTTSKCSNFKTEPSISISSKKHLKKNYPHYSKNKKEPCVEMGPHLPDENNLTKAISSATRTSIPSKEADMSSKKEVDEYLEIGPQLASNSGMDFSKNIDLNTDCNTVSDSSAKYTNIPHSIQNGQSDASSSIDDSWEMSLKIFEREFKGLDQDIGEDSPDSTVKKGDNFLENTSVPCQTSSEPFGIRGVVEYDNSDEEEEMSSSNISSSKPESVTAHRVRSEYELSRDEGFSYQKQRKRDSKPIVSQSESQRNPFKRKFSGEAGESEDLSLKKSKQKNNTIDFDKIFNNHSNSDKYGFGFSRQEQLNLESESFCRHIQDSKETLSSESKIVHNEDNNFNKKITDVLSCKNNSFTQSSNNEGTSYENDRTKDVSSSRVDEDIDEIDRQLSEALEAKGIRGVVEYDNSDEEEEMSSSNISSSKPESVTAHKVRSEYELSRDEGFSYQKQRKFDSKSKVSQSESQRNPFKRKFSGEAGESEDLSLKKSKQKNNTIDFDKIFNNHSNSDKYGFGFSRQEQLNLENESFCSTSSHNQSNYGKSPNDYKAINFVKSDNVFDSSTLNKNIPSDNTSQFNSNETEQSSDNKNESIYAPGPSGLNLVRHIQDSKETLSSESKIVHNEDNNFNKKITDVLSCKNNSLTQSSNNEPGTSHDKNKTKDVSSSRVDEDIDETDRQLSEALAAKFLSKDSSEAETSRTNVQQLPSSWSTASSSVASSASNSTTGTDPDDSSVSLPNTNVTPSNLPKACPRVLLRRCDREASQMGAKVWLDEAFPRVTLVCCDSKAIEMGAKVWREERIIWAPFGKNQSYWPGIIFSPGEIGKPAKPKYNHIFWFKAHNYSTISEDQVCDFRKHFQEKFSPEARNKNKAVLEALKLLAAMSNISQNIDFIDWALSGFPGFQKQDEVLLDFMRPFLAKLKQEED